MGKVKAQPVRIDIGAVLLHMGAQHFPERLLEQVGGAVVPSNQPAFFPVHCKLHGIAIFEHPGGNNTHMADAPAPQVDGVLHPELIFPGADYACICILPAHGSIKWGFLHNNSAPLPVGQCFCQFCFRCQHSNPGSMAEPVIPHKL